MTIKEFIEKESFFTNEYLLVKSASSGTASNGNKYWNIELADKTGSIQGKIWSPLAVRVEPKVGDVVIVTGKYGSYQGAPQTSIENILICSEHEAELCRDGLMQGPKEDITVLANRFFHLVNRIEQENKPLADAVNELYADKKKFHACPGGKVVHHAYRGGLLEHTVSVMDICLERAKGSTVVNLGVVLAAAALHDYGKMSEYSMNGAADITTRGKLLGHICLAMHPVQAAFEKHGVDEDIALHVLHCIVAHHGNKEWGSPVEPLTCEAMLLHQADLFDSSMSGVMSFVAEAGLNASTKKCFVLGGKTPMVFEHSLKGEIETSPNNEPGNIF